MSHKSANKGFVPPTPKELDAILEAYDFIEMLGQGGMGAVYKARQKSLDRLVAIKILPASLIAEDDGQDGFRFEERFQREARAMARLGHPNIISVYDFGQSSDGQCFFVMEYVEGTNLHAILQAGGLTIEHVSGWMTQICDALHYAHARGIVHRDIKPANIMVTREGQVKIADFGLAKLTGAGDVDTKLTLTHMAMGTPDYVAPEALESGLEVDHRADLFALGVMLYELLTGKVPRGAWKPPSTLVPGLDPRYDLIVEKAMEADRESRYQQASEISATFYQIATTPPPSPASAPSEPAASVEPARSSRSRRLPPRAVQPAPAKAGRGAGLSLGIGGAVVLLIGAAWFLFRKPPAAVSPELGVPPATPAALALEQGSVEPGKVTPMASTVPEEDTIPPPSPPAAQPASSTAAPEMAPLPAPAPVPVPAETVAAVEGGPRFSGVTFPRDLGNPQSPGWTFEEGRIVIDDESARFPTFVVPVAAGGNHEFEMEFSAFEEDPGNAYLQIMTPLRHGWISLQIDRGRVMLLPDQRRLVHGSPGILGREKRRIRMICSETGGGLRAKVMLDGEEIFDEAVEPKGEVLNWTNLSREFITIGGESKGHSRFSIHEIRVTPGGAPDLPRDGAIPGGGMAPAPANTTLAPPLPARPVDPRLVQLEEGFQARLEKDAEGPRRAALEALNRSYVANALARARGAAQTRGILEEVTAIDAEKALIESAGGLPDDIAADAALPESLRSLRRTYRDAVAKLNENWSAAAAPVYDLYLGALDARVAELTRGNEIERAREVRAFRDQVASRKPGPGPSSEGPPAAAPAAAAVASEPVRRSVREIAESAIGLGATLSILDGGNGFSADKLESLPKGRFDLIELNLDRLNSPRKPLKAEDFAGFVGVETLQRVWIRPMDSKLSDDAFRFLAGNRELQFLHLEGVGGVTDAILDHLRDATKLNTLSIQYAAGFTGAGLRDHPVAKSIVVAEFLGSGITDEGMAAIAACPELTSVRVTSLNVTDRGFAALGGLSKLQHLLVERTAFGDDAAAAIAGLSDLRELVLGGTAITDRGLARLAGLKDLRTLDLTSAPGVSERAVQQLREALPDCVITAPPGAQ